MAIRNEKGQLVKGHGGLKGAGRPSGGVAIQNYVRSISNNMQDYIFMLDEITRDPKTNIKDKINCIKELLDRGAGRAPQHNINENYDKTPYSKVIELVNKRINDDNTK